MARKTLKELDRFFVRPIIKREKMEHEIYLEIFHELSEEAKMGICVMIASLRLNKRNRCQFGALTGLELIMELVKEGIL
jgi:hypothetical protein